jgi:hypothetical protein
VGGDLVKAVFIAKEQERKTIAVATVSSTGRSGYGALFGLCS